jgi:predicted nucleic acid-binding protein
MYLLDTNIVSELRKDTGRANPGVEAWARSSIGRREGGRRAFLSVIVLMELEKGVRLAERRDPFQGAILREWLERRVRRDFEGAILPVTEPVAMQAAAYQVPDPAPVADALIAATAAVHGLTVVSRNVNHYRPMGVAVLNPFTA